MMDPLTGDASKRKYFRLYHNDGTLIGVHGEDDKENRSFIYFCNHLYSLNLPVPRLYASSIEKGIYIIEDLGTETLAEKISSPSITKEEILSLYIQSTKDLVNFQILGHVGIDYENNCHQSPVLDRKNIVDDLKYFTKNFFSLANDYLKIYGIENELNRLVDILAEPQPMFFLYRDFQCRNIIVRPDKKLGYVDFQAGRKGPLQYDIVTLLYSSKANISNEERKIILSSYLNQLEMLITSLKETDKTGKVLESVRLITRNNFMSTYHFFVLFRILRALGVYLFLAVQEGHWRFLEGVPEASKNLVSIFCEQSSLGEIFPQLQKFAHRLNTEDAFLSPTKLISLISSHTKMVNIE
ncbi:MAG: phosphotransferase [Pseudomonadota bacterium]